MFSAVILTLNEERALPACLASLRDCDDIVVLDSGSSDGTAAIALAAGARVRGSLAEVQEKVLHAIDHEFDQP